MTDVYAMKKLLSATGMTIALDEGRDRHPVRDRADPRARRSRASRSRCRRSAASTTRGRCATSRCNAGLKLIGSRAAWTRRSASRRRCTCSRPTASAYPVDLNGPQFIAEDYLKTPLPIERQVALVPTGPGLGIEIDEAKVAGFRLPLRDLMRASPSAAVPAGARRSRRRSFPPQAGAHRRRRSRRAARPTSPRGCWRRSSPRHVGPAGRRREQARRRAQHRRRRSSPSAAPDGHTLLLATTALATSAAIFDKLAYDPQKDLAPVVMRRDDPEPARGAPFGAGDDAAELRRATPRRIPGKLNFASPGASTGQRLTFELFKQMTGIDVVHVAYKGGAPAVQALLGGRGAGDDHERRRGAALREAPASCARSRPPTAKRAAMLPEVPTLGRNGRAGPRRLGLAGRAGRRRHAGRIIHARITRRLDGRARAAGHRASA